ncbi:unnamed protein product [Pedinophyceae sp. YPF-701]|nr:unnamed protein product [Pedinophyceae sp. YPF-701]
MQTAGLVASRPCVLRACSSNKASGASVRPLATQPRPAVRFGRVEWSCRGPAPAAAADSTKSEVAGTDRSIDVGRIAKYVGATTVEVGVMTAALAAVQFAVSHPSSPLTAQPWGTAFVFVFFFTMSIKSRVFSPLDARRPSADGTGAVWEVKRPSWQPPPVVFPIVWSTIAVLRAASATMIWQANDALLCVPIMAFMLHLAIGDTWNHINNVELRKGGAALGVLFVWASAAFATHMYAQTLPKAAYVLAPSLVWLAIAACLIWSIWDLNGREELIPTTSKATA